MIEPLDLPDNRELVEAYEAHVRALYTAMGIPLMVMRGYKSYLEYLAVEGGSSEEELRERDHRRQCSNYAAAVFCYRPY